VPSCHWGAGLIRGVSRIERGKCCAQSDIFQRTWWAEDNPGAYWDAADLYERANGRLYVSGDFALPRGLSTEDQVEIAREFVHALTEREKLPYTFAVHAGADADGQEHNPHVHVMISERQNDGIERNERDWFRRANREQPERGGAAKTRSFHGRQWVERAREKIADVINDKLQELGRDERVDHRSYAAKGWIANQASTSDPTHRTWSSGATRTIAWRRRQACRITQTGSPTSRVRSAISSGCATSSLTKQTHPILAPPTVRTVRTGRGPRATTTARAGGGDDGQCA
jgi:hypothetical protein